MVYTWFTLGLHWFTVVITIFIKKPKKYCLLKNNAYNCIVKGLEIRKTFILTLARLSFIQTSHDSRGYFFIQLFMNEEIFYYTLYKEGSGFMISAPIKVTEETDYYNLYAIRL